LVRTEAVAIEPLAELARRMHDDPRPILPPLARRALNRLSRSVEKAYAASILAIAVRRVGETGHRIHPFDLPELARHIKSDADSLGPAERAYMALAGMDRDEGGPDGGHFFNRITLDNWTTFPKAHRKAFIAGMRRDDPSGARSLVESVWKTETAPVRLALLEAFAVGLSAEDQPFLESLGRDRAETVRHLGQQLIARVPSTAGHEQRLAAAAACFGKPKGRLAGFLGAIGLGGQDPVFAVPVDSKNRAEMLAAKERLFEGLPLAAIAKAVGEPPERILNLLPPAEHKIIMLLLDTALTEGDVPTARMILGARLVEKTEPSSAVLIELADKARLTLAVPFAGRLLETGFWRQTIATHQAATTPASARDNGVLVFAATLMPRETMPAFVKTIEPLAAATARSARDFADLILALPPSASASR